MRTKQQSLLAAGAMALASLLPLAPCAAAVKIVGAEGAWSLERNGRPYFVRGAGGVDDYAAFASVGGNSVRVWDECRARERLDAADRHGLTLMVGLWLAHQSDDARYSDPEWCERMAESALSVVRANKDHPAVLLWALGNEMEMGIADEDALWRFIGDLARRVKEIDPDHPVGTVVAEINPKKVEKMMRLAPALDWVGINTYGRARDVGRRWREYGGKRPYLLTEFGPPGPTESGRNGFGCLREWTSTAKADWYEKVYRGNVMADAGSWCLGSYAFIWTHKVEGTATWFGMHTSDGDVLASAERLQSLWDVVPPANRVPCVDPLVLSKDVLTGAGDSLTAEVRASDADGDALSYDWFVWPEVSRSDGLWRGVQIPARVPGMIVAGAGTPRVTVRGGAEAGKFRLYCRVRDGKGGAALACQPLLVKEGRRGE